MKKLITLLLAVAMLLPCAACKKGGEGTAGDIPTLKWVVPGNPEPDIATVMDAANEILVEKLGCKLDLQIIEFSAYDERLKLMMSGGESFDLCYVNNTSFTDGVSKGGFLSLEDYIDDTKLPELVGEDILKYGEYKGELYAIPNVQIMAVTDNIWVQEQFAKEYGLKADSIKSYNDMEPFFQWIKENKPGNVPIRITSSQIRNVKGFENAYYDDLVSNMVYAYETEDGKVKVVKATDYPGFWELVTLKNDWYKKGYIRSDVATVYGDDWDDVGNGKYGAYTQTYKPGGIEAQNSTPGEIPHVEVNPTPGFMSYSAGCATMTAVNAKTKNPELVLDFIELMNSDKELYNIITFGVEGKHYTVGENGKITLNREGGYCSNAGWKFGNQYNALVIEGQPDDVWEQTKKVNDEAKMSKLTGFKPDLSKIKLEISQLETVKGKYSSIQRGYDDPNNYKDAYLAELQSAGIEKVVTELQAQVDEFLGQ